MFQRKNLPNDRIRVLVNGIHAKSGGGVTYLRNILPLLAEDEALELHLYLHREQRDLFGGVGEKVQVHILEYSNSLFLDVLWEQFVLPIHAKFLSVDVTFSPANFGPLLAPRPIIMLRNSLTVAGHEARPIKRLYWKGVTLMTALSLLTCKRAIAVSNYAMRTLTFGMGSRLDNKVAIVHHGVQEAFHPPIGGQRQEFLLFVSDIYVQKNLHTLISALSLVRESLPNCKLKLAGRAIDKSYLNEVKETVKSAKLETAVEFLGEKTTEELVELYQSCALFVFPSTVETFGNPLVEAMACGTPIASSNCAAMPEILGNAARYFNPLDAKDMCETITYLLKNKNAQKELIINSLKRAKSFSWYQTAKKTAEVIKSVAPSRSLKFDGDHHSLKVWRKSGD